MFKVVDDLWQVNAIKYIFCSINPLTPRVSTWMIQSFLTFHSMDSVAIHWKAVERYFAVVLFVF